MHPLLLKCFSSIAPITEEETAAIDATMRTEVLKKGTPLLREGQYSPETFFVIEGIVRKYYLVDGEEKTSDFFTAGQWVLSIINIDHSLHANYFLECSTDCILAVGNSQKGEELYRTYPNLGTISRKMMEQIFKLQQEKLETYLTDTPEIRYIKLMHSEPELFQYVPQYHIASYIGVKPESLSRIRKRILKPGS